jgi:hypothetical protein
MQHQDFADLTIVKAWGAFLLAKISSLIIALIPSGDPTHLMDLFKSALQSLSFLAATTYTVIKIYQEAQKEIAKRKRARKLKVK